MPSFPTSQYTDHGSFAMKRIKVVKVYYRMKSSEMFGAPVMTIDS